LENIKFKVPYRLRRKLSQTNFWIQYATHDFSFSIQNGRGGK